MSYNQADNTADAFLPADSLLFVSPDEADMLVANVLSEPVTIPVVVFQPNATEPYRVEYRGQIVSASVNAERTKGRFVFSEGTTIHMDASFVA